MIRKATLAVGLLAVVINAGIASARPAADAADVSTQVRREIALFPYTGIFDWIEADVHPDGMVVLRGEVLQPSSRKDAEFRLRRLEAVSNVINDIRVLPLSRADNDIRVAVYRSFFNTGSTLVGYALGTNPSVHIIVENGRVTLKGVVSSEVDRRVAYVKARSVFGVLDVDNQLRLESEL
jgi:hyperosmotically inducible protein